jgi:hypothetical protein
MVTERIIMLYNLDKDLPRHLEQAGTSARTVRFKLRHMEMIAEELQESPTDLDWNPLENYIQEIETLADETEERLLLHDSEIARYAEQNRFQRMFQFLRSDGRAFSLSGELDGFLTYLGHVETSLQT